MQTRFVASQSVEIAVAEEPIPMQHYLRQPQRLVHALFDPNRTEQLGNDRFRLKLRPLNFMGLTIQPTADVRVWAEANGTVHLQSIACQIRGVDYINDRFSLNLVGQLQPYSSPTGTRLRGRADLEVKIELPPPFCFTPRPILETAGNGLLKSVLMTIDQRLTHQLLKDYHHWAATETTGVAAQRTSRLAVDGTIA